MCETHRFHGAPRADRRRNSGILCRVAHELWDFWLKNSGMCATVHTQTWLKNYGILHWPPPQRRAQLVARLAGPSTPRCP